MDALATHTYAKAIKAVLTSSAPGGYGMTESRANDLLESAAERIVAMGEEGVKVGDAAEHLWDCFSHA